MFFVHLTPSGIKNLNERLNSLEIGHRFTKKVWLDEDRKFYLFYSEEELINKIKEEDDDGVFPVRLYPLKEEWIWAKYIKDFIFAPVAGKEEIADIINKLEL